MPFVIKAGKALDERKVEVRIRFNAVAGAVPSVSRCAPNELIVRVQPDEMIYWKVQSKAPGLDFHIEQQRMDLLYSSDQKREMPEAYERLILEVLRGGFLALDLCCALSDGETIPPAVAQLLRGRPRRGVGH